MWKHLGDGNCENKNIVRYFGWIYINSILTV